MSKKKEDGTFEEDIVKTYWFNIPLWGWFLISFIAGIITGIILGA